MKYYSFTIRSDVSWRVLTGNKTKVAVNYGVARRVSDRNYYYSADLTKRTKPNETFIK